MDTETDPRTPLTASRRRVIIAGGATVLGVAGLTACGSDDSTGSTGTTDQATTPAGASDGELASGGELATPASANVPVIDLSEVPEGGAVAANAGGLALLVTRPAGGDPKVFSSTCPHQGCTVAPNGTTNLLCPCHQSSFAIDTGAVTPGSPASTGLPSYPSEVVDGKVVLTSTTPQAPA